MSRLSGVPPVMDFASAAMIRVLAQGMRDLELQPPQHLLSNLDGGARVPLDQKRQLVASAVEQGGIESLALLGRGLRLFTHEPTHNALVSARDTYDLFDRWIRLERYIHSRHRIEVLTSSTRGASIVHLSRSQYPAPLPAEDLVVLGVLVALLEAIGVTGVAAQVGKVQVYPTADRQELSAAVRRQQTATWSITWDEPAATNRNKQVKNTHVPKVIPPQVWPKHAQESFMRLCNELTNPLSLPALAEALGAAPRSLQRVLNRDGLSYTRLLRDARCHVASWWLINSKVAIAEVGFVSGYADQPHFTRDFRDQVGMTPLIFRSDFAVAT